MKYVHIYLISGRAFIVFDISVFSQELEKSGKDLILLNVS